ncbi:hypothetical protein GH740_11530 [Microbacterium sp. SYP-A9085]|uniref:hypothetical protein n=1 Tax=Microbacterium sp. SYP-A9085 TaxID=2664454 RepID=UPI00129BF1AE|nr:hypothetical protein [Microbacterium sp. SYP-A9085]MRH29933.1 hypothetical protein [Microbacterium sp. SYP-A9085]
MRTMAGGLAGRVGAGLVLAGLVLGLAACSGGASYSSPEALKDAYVDAGGSCDHPQDLPESMISEGAHAILCAPPMAMLFVFDSEDAKNRWIATTGDSDMYTVAGERWAVAGEDKGIIDKLGGAEVKR